MGKDVHTIRIPLGHKVAIQWEYPDGEIHERLVTEEVIRCLGEIRDALLDFRDLKDPLLGKWLELCLADESKIADLARDIAEEIKELKKRPQHIHIRPGIFKVDFEEDE